MTRIAVVVVTHNSDKFMPTTLASLADQQPLPQVIVVDSGSQSTDCLEKLCVSYGFQLLRFTNNIGFCSGNNRGALKILDAYEYILFLNPDCFIPASFCATAARCMSDPVNKDIGILTTELHGFDIESKQPTGRYDSTGIFRTWYGKWYDRDQGKPISSERMANIASEDALEAVPAACGALMFCRATALKDVLLPNSEIFDEKFFMYKEDIDLCRRMKRRDWKVSCARHFHAFHCRGWNTDRKRMPHSSRMLSARNEIRINEKENLICLSYSLLKFMAVRLLNI